MKSFMRKTKFRKIVAGFCLAVLCTGSVLTVQAAPSPSNSDLKPEVVSPSQSGSNSQTTNSDSDTNSNTGSSTTVTNTSNITTIDSDTERYENKAVADAVGKTDM